MEKTSAPTRDSVPAEYKWRLEDIYADLEEWETEYAETEKLLPAIDALKDTLLGSADGLKKGLDFLNEGRHKLERLFIFARMRRDENNADSTYQALTDRANGLIVRFSAASSYIDPLLLSVDESVLLGYLDECEGLKPYAFYIRELLRSKQHILSEKEEKLLSMTGDFADGTQEAFIMLNNADLDFGSVEHNGENFVITHGSFIVAMMSKDRELRKKVYEKFYGEFKAHINTIGALYANAVKRDVFYAKARGFSSARAHALFSDNIPETVYDKLIEGVHASLPTMYKYLALRKKALGVEKLHMYDVYVPIVGDSEAKYSFEDARDIVLKALEPLGEKYMSVLKTAFTDGWIDVAETAGKTTGAYSWGVYGTHPYVLLNHKETLDSVFTLAHELGHAMHTHLSNSTQPYSTASYPIFVAEIASTVNEVLLTKHLLEVTEEPELKKYILNHYIEQFKGTVLRQTMFAEFEKKVHAAAEAGEPLTPSSLSSMYKELNTLYFGEDMISDDDTIMYEWARIPHFYRGFYVYKYATGLSTAVAIASGLDKPEMLDKYLRFLSSGGSDHPLNLIAEAGISFDTVVDKCMAEFERALTELSELMY